VNGHAFGGVLVVDLDLLGERGQERGQALDTVLVTAKKQHFDKEGRLHLDTR
jgi:hypothetical protein